MEVSLLNAPLLGDASLNDAPPVDSDEYTLRERARLLVYSIPFQSLAIIVLMTDVILIFTSLATKMDLETVSLTVIILVFFTLETLLKIYAMTPALFFKNMFDVLDAVIILLSVVFFIAEEIEAANGTAMLRTLRIVTRVTRVVRALHFGNRKRMDVQQALRNKVGGNKKRFVDLKNGFDLDLTYILPHLIAMSVPATGKISIFRNPIEEVARFFNSRHGIGHYRLYNCCPEHPYPSGPFGGGNAVKCYDVQVPLAKPPRQPVWHQWHRRDRSAGAPSHACRCATAQRSLHVTLPTPLPPTAALPPCRPAAPPPRRPAAPQDHTPPSMALLVDAVNDMEAFLAEAPTNVVAAHCRGGKVGQAALFY
jgi:hypothetical protein